MPRRLMNITQPFKILKMDKRRGNIVVSRRAILEEDRAEHRQEVVKDLTEGDQREGIRQEHYRLRRIRRTCAGR